jgi:hypothetical protein
LTNFPPRKSAFIGALVTDALGRAIDGTDDSQPGSNYVATFSRSGVTTGGPTAVQTNGPAASTVAAVDALIARDELAELTGSHRARREARPVTL